MHVASHLIKARSRVLKHNTKLREQAAKARAEAQARRLEAAIKADAEAEAGGRQKKRRRRKRSGSKEIPSAASLDAKGVTHLDDVDGGDNEEAAKDQGFTRPRVLVLLPFRNSCYTFINRLLALLPIKVRLAGAEGCGVPFRVLIGFGWPRLL